LAQPKIAERISHGSSEDIELAQVLNIDVRILSPLVNLSQVEKPSELDVSQRPFEAKSCILNILLPFFFVGGHH
jgi:hypothetical protein